MALVIEVRESCVFEACSHKWKLVLYPGGDLARNVNDHLSLYLAIDDSSPLPPAWEVDVLYRFFVFDQIRDSDLTLGESGGRVRLFHWIRTRWGFSKLMSLERFTDPANGYVVDDSCEFGVEVFVVGNTGATECLTMFKSSSAYTHTWKIENFSQLGEDEYSDIFTAADHKWKINIVPNGYNDGKDNSISLFIHRAYSEVPLEAEIYVKYKIKLRSQIDNHTANTGYCWFKTTLGGWGWTRFISIDEFQNQSKGFLMNNTCIIEAKITVLGSNKIST